MMFRLSQLLVWILKSGWDYWLLSKVCRFKEKRLTIVALRIVLNALLSFNIWTIANLPLWLAWGLQVIADMVMILDLRRQKQADALVFEQIVYTTALESGWLLALRMTWSWSTVLTASEGSAGLVIPAMLSALFFGSLQFATLVMQNGTGFDRKTAFLLLAVMIVNVTAAQASVNMDARTGAIFCLGAWVYSTLFLAACRYLFERKRLRKKEEQLALAAKSLEQMQADAEQNDLRLRQMKHSLKDHLMIVQILCRQNRNEEADAYLDTLLGELDFERFEFYCDDPLLNALLNQMVLSHPGVRFEMKIDPALKNIPYKFVEAMFLAADNACDELERHADLPRKVDVSLQKERRRLVGVIENPLSAKKDLKTEKAGSFHGIGLPQIRRLIGELDGSVMIQQNEQFVLTLQAPIANREMCG